MSVVFTFNKIPPPLFLINIKYLITKTLKAPLHQDLSLKTQLPK